MSAATLLSMHLGVVDKATKAQWLAVRLGCLLSALTTSSAHGAPVTVALVAPEPPVVADGTTVREIQIRVDAPGKRVGRRLNVRASRGKVLSVGPIVDGVTTITYRPPRSKKKRRVRLVVTTYAGSRRVKRKLKLELWPPGAVAATDGTKLTAVGAAADAASAAGGQGVAAASAVPADLPPPPPLSSTHRVVALLPIEAPEIVDELVSSVRGSLLREIDETEGLEAVSAADMTRDLEKIGLSVGCERDLPCMARAGLYSRAHWVAETQLVSLGGTLYISMGLIDSVQGLELRRVAKPLSQDEDARAKELHVLAVELLTPEANRGTLVIECAQTEADIYLDDELLGRTPLSGPTRNLRAGTHILHATKEGYANLYQFVEVVYRRSATVNVDLRAARVSAVLVQQESSRGLGSLFVATDVPGVELRVDGEPMGRTPLEEPLAGIAAGEHRLSLRLGEAKAVKISIQIEPKQRTDIHVALAGDMLHARQLGVVAVSSALPDAAELGVAATALLPMDGSSPEAGIDGLLLGGLVSAGVGLLALAAGSLLAAQVDARQGELDQLRGKSLAADLDYETYRQLEARRSDINGQGETLELVQWICVGSGAALLVAGGGLALWALTDSPSSDSAAFDAAVVPTVSWWRGGPLLGIVKRF